MKSKLVWALVALNVLLVTTLVGQWLKPNAAMAQLGRAADRASDYILIPGTVQGSPTQVVYMIDTQNHLLSARLFNGNGFQDMMPIPLDRVFGGGANTRRR